MQDGEHAWEAENSVLKLSSVRLVLAWVAVGPVRELPLENLRRTACGDPWVSCSTQLGGGEVGVGVRESGGGDAAGRCAVRVCTSPGLSRPDSAGTELRVC